MNVAKTVMVVTAVAIAIVIWSSEWTPRRGNHRPCSPADDRADRTANQASAYRASCRSCSLYWSGACSEREGGEQDECEFVHIANLMQTMTN